MRLAILNEDIEILYWSEDLENPDPWVSAEEAEISAKMCSIGIDRNKELKFIAYDNVLDKTVGGVWSAIVQEEEPYYDFDVVVRQNARGGRVGIDLIKSAIQDARESGVNLIRVYVVNTKLIGILERYFGFDVESTYSHGAAHMVCYI